MAADDGVALRIAARQVVLDRALRSGSASLGARAAARVRLPAVHLGPAQMALARHARVRLGKLIREERVRRTSTAAEIGAGPVAAVATSPAPARRLRVPIPALAIVALLLIVAAFVFFGGDGNPEGATKVEGTPDATPGAPSNGASVARAIAINLAGITDPLFRAATPPPPQPTDAPPAPPAPVVARPAPNPGGGTVGNGGTATAAPRATPAPPAPTAAPTPGAGPGVLPPLLPGFRRFQGFLTDSNGTPLTGVCVQIGPRECQPISHFSDSSGSWWEDVPIGDGNITWDFHFTKPGFYEYTVRVAPNGQPPFIIPLQPAPIRNN